jgi:CheY-like chemotaxis protein
MAAALVIVVAGLLWLGRCRQQRARDETARREAEHLAQAQHAAGAARAAAAAAAETRRQAEQAAQAARDALAREAAQAERRAAEVRQAEREQAEREELARQHSERLAAQAAQAAQAAEAQRAHEAAAQAAERAAAAAAAARQTAVAERELRADETLVLVADDSKIVRVKISRLLAAQGYRVALAESGEQALALMAGERPHVLITDVEMPGIDGFELTRQVRASTATAALPVVMITSSDDKQAEAGAAGVTQLLGKPYPEAALIAAIERARLAVRVPA